MLTLQITPIYLGRLSTSDQSTRFFLMRNGGCCPLPVLGFFGPNPKELLSCQVTFRVNAGALRQPV